MKKTVVSLIVILLFIACGGRKSETQTKEESFKTDFSGIFRNSGNSQFLLNTELNLKTNYLDRWSDNSVTENNEFTVEPDDATKPSSVTMPNGEKYVFQNAKLTTKNSKYEKKIIEENSGNSEEIRKTNQLQKKQESSEVQVKQKAAAALAEKNKKAEREEWSSLNLLWILLFIIVCLIVWKLWKKYKKIKPLL